MGFFTKNGTSEREVAVELKGVVNESGCNSVVAVFDNGDEITLGTAENVNADYVEQVAGTPDAE